MERMPMALYDDDESEEHADVLCVEKIKLSAKELRWLEHIEATVIVNSNSTTVWTQAIGPIIRRYLKVRPPAPLTLLLDDTPPTACGERGKMLGRVNKEWKYKRSSFHITVGLLWLQKNTPKIMHMRLAEIVHAELLGAKVEP